MAETDLISRQAAIDSIEKHLRFGDELYPLTDTDKVLNHAFAIAASCVYNLPSAQPERMTNGHWIFRPFPDDWIGSLYICSECGDVCDSRYRFCPSCGAKMDEF